MRRVIVTMVAAGLVTGAMAGPALASSNTAHRFKGAAAIAEWQSKVQLPKGRFQVTTWFVDLFSSSRGTSAEVFKEVVNCKLVNGHRRCRFVSFSDGFRRNLTAKQFTFDRKHLQVAHLDAAFRLRTFMRGKPSRTSRVTVVTDWAGTGKISHSGGVDSFHSRCVHYHDTFKERQRMATATGSVNGKSLGSAKRASLSTNTNIVVQHRC